MSTLRMWASAVVTTALAAALVAALPSAGHADQSFRAPTSWGGPFPRPGVLDNNPPFQMADVNNDRLQDVVHFGKTGVTVGFSNGHGFDLRFVLGDLGADQGWQQSYHVRAPRET